MTVMGRWTCFEHKKRRTKTGIPMCPPAMCRPTYVAMREPVPVSGKSSLNVFERVRCSARSGNPDCLPESDVAIAVILQERKLARLGR